MDEIDSLKRCLISLTPVASPSEGLGILTTTYVSGEERPDDRQRLREGFKNSSSID